MKKAIAVAVVLFLLATKGFTWGQKGHRIVGAIAQDNLTEVAQKSDAKQLDKLARQFGQAWLNADVQTLDHLLSREYMHTDVTGKVLHRADWLADAANAQKWLRAPEGDSKPSIEFEDMTVKLIGDAAVITGENVIHSANPQATPIKLRFMQVWIKENGEWKRRFFEATPVLDSKR